MQVSLYSHPVVMHVNRDWIWNVVSLAKYGVSQYIMHPRWQHLILFIIRLISYPSRFVPGPVVVTPTTKVFYCTVCANIFFHPKPHRSADGINSEKSQKWYTGLAVWIDSNLYIYKEGESVGHGVPINCSAVCGPIWLKLWWMVGKVMITIAPRWRPDRPLGVAAWV